VENGSFHVTEEWVENFKKRAEIYAILGHYAAYIGVSLPTFRDHLSVSSSRVKKSKIFQKSEDLFYLVQEV